MTEYTPTPRATNYVTVGYTRQRSKFRRRVLGVHFSREKGNTYKMSHVVSKRTEWIPDAILRLAIGFARRLGPWFERRAFHLFLRVDEGKTK